MASITLWTRLEPLNELAENIQESARAAVHDPLWLLAKQHQSGEFTGQDAASPMGVAIDYRSALLARIKSWDGSVEIDVPGVSAVKIEREVPNLSASHDDHDYVVAAETGGLFADVLRQRMGETMGDHIDYLIEREASLIQPFLIDAKINISDQVSEAYLEMLNTRLLDGERLYAASDTEIISAFKLASTADVVKAIGDWRQIAQPLLESSAIKKNPPALWSDERLEYRFESEFRYGDNLVARLLSSNYVDGDLDWPDFELAQPMTWQVANTTRITLSNISRASFPGMPALRYWEFEDGTVDYGNAHVQPTDLLHLLAIQYATQYANNTYLVQFELPFGSLTQTQKVAVTNAFGEVWEIPRAVGNWEMFNLSLGREASDPVMLLPATGVAVQSSDPIETIVFGRDEVANLAWAVVELGTSVAGTTLREAAAFRPVAVPKFACEDGLTYVPESFVAPNWIALEMPEDALSAKQLMLKIKTMRDKSPYAHLVAIREGMTVFAEEVPKEGVRVTRLFRRTRDIDGSTLCWIARKVTTGKGEVTSNLRFDYLADDALK